MKTADVIVVGGGVIGLSVAYRLARHGQRVIVAERQRCGQEASWASAGVLAPCSWHRRDDLARMHMDSLFGYHEFAAELRDQSGIDPRFVGRRFDQCQCGFCGLSE